MTDPTGGTAEPSGIGARNDDPAGVRDAVAGLATLFTALDAEDWELVISHLDQDVVLADELTGTWLRGHEAVARYLRAQEGIVTEIVSEPTDVAARHLGNGNWLITFNFTQRYRLIGAEHREQLTGCCVLRLQQPSWQLVVFHLGGLAKGIEARTVPATPGEPLADEHSETGEHAPGERSATTPAEVGPATEPPGVPSLGDVLRGHRERRRLSLRALADESGLSASFLSQVERGLTDPSVGSLRRIAQGLGVRISELLDDGSPAMPGVELARQQDRQTIELAHSGVAIEPFPVTESVGLSAQIRRYSADVAFASDETAHEDDELLYVVEGRLELVTGDARAVLGAGDGAIVRRRSRHGLRPVPGDPPRVLVVRSRME